ncbi:MAG: rhodanese-like domain-containing protein [Candidatus Obscuribacterales bacterium]|nr:rhodanese-like domain-containing protein [Steroidobacteraceae bacterium]
MHKLTSVLTLMVLTIGAVLAADIIDITADKLQSRIEKKDAAIVLLDVRTAEEFAQGHVPGAKNIPHDQLAERVSELLADKDKEVVLYCRSGRRAGIAAETLQAKGFEKLLHLEGDMQKWSAENRPVEK